MLKQFVDIIISYFIIFIRYIYKISGKELKISIIRNILDYGTIEAVNRQGIDFSKEFSFCVLSIDDRYSIKFVENIFIVSVPINRIKFIIQKLSPDITVIFHSCLSDIINYRCIYNGTTLFVLTSLDPLNDVNVESIHFKNIMHLNDIGTLRIVCHADQAKLSLETAGLSIIDVIPPYIQLEKFVKNTESSRNIKTFGFASAPFQRKDYVNKGFINLVESFSKDSRFNLIIPWRSETFFPLESLPPSVRVLRGAINMESFYESIDAVVIPFLNTRNHAFPLSLIESLVARKPVLVSNICGAGDWVKKIKGGVLFDPGEQQIGQAATTLIHDLKVGSINVVDSSACVAACMDEWRRQYAIVLELLRIKKHTVDLLTWDKRLRDVGSDLVVGKKNIESYYQQKEIADNYVHDRFVPANQDGISTIEINFVDYCCKTLKCKKTMIDIASGTGRFNPIYCNFKNVFMLDSSERMLHICRDSEWFDKEKITLIKGNIFNFHHKKKFDAIVCFRLLRHLLVNERRIVFKELKNMLSNTGRLFFDLPLHDSEMVIRSFEGWHNYNIYDCFWDFEMIENEVKVFGLLIDDIKVIPGSSLGARWRGIKEYQLILSIKHAEPEVGL